MTIVWIYLDTNKEVGDRDQKFRYTALARINLLPPARSSGRCSGLTRPPITAPRRRARPGWRQCAPRRRRACGRRWTSTSRAGAAPCGPERHGRQPGPRWQDNAVNELLTNKVRD